MSNLQNDLKQNFPSSKIQILAVNEFGQERDYELATEATTLPLLQDVDQNNNGLSDVWKDSWGVEWRDVRVLNANNESRGVVNLTANSLAVAANYNNLRATIVTAATESRVAATRWQNRVEPYDVSGDGFIVPNDVLRIVNRINASSESELSAVDTVNNFYDVNGDGHVTPRDALQVIRQINRFSLGASGEPDHDTAPPPPFAADAVDRSLIDRSLIAAALGDVTVETPIGKARAGSDYSVAPPPMHPSVIDLTFSEGAA